MCDNAWNALQGFRRVARPARFDRVAVDDIYRGGRISCGQPQSAAGQGGGIERQSRIWLESGAGDRDGGEVGLGARHRNGTRSE